MKKRKRADETRPPIVALCDISGSMSQYTRILLHFLHALTEERRDVHTFLFGTRLTNVTRSLRMKDPDEALMACTQGVEDWSGGTRIATALAAFNRQWSRRVLSGNPIVLLVTDGLERDTDEDLAREVDRLHRSCRRLIWLNPLLRFEGFEARAKGVRALLPHVDEFRAVHSLDAVEDLCKALARADGPRALETDPRSGKRQAPKQLVEVVSGIVDTRKRRRQEERSFWEYPAYDEFIEMTYPIRAHFAWLDATLKQMNVTITFTVYRYTGTQWRKLFSKDFSKRGTYHYVLPLQAFPQNRTAAMQEINQRMTRLIDELVSWPFKG